MRFVYANLDQARQARARLKEAVEERLPGRKVELTLAGAALAAATGYSGWAELKKAVDPAAATPWENPGDAGAQVRDAHRAAAVAPAARCRIRRRRRDRRKRREWGRRPLAGDRGSPAASAASRTPPTPPTPARRTGDAPALVLADAGEERRITVAPAWAGSGLSYTADRPCVAAVVGSDLDAVARSPGRGAPSARRSALLGRRRHARGTKPRTRTRGRRQEAPDDRGAEGAGVARLLRGVRRDDARDRARRTAALSGRPRGRGVSRAAAPCFGPIGPDCFKDGGIGLAVGTRSGESGGVRALDPPGRP